MPRWEQRTAWERFIEKVDKQADGCWIWTAAKMNKEGHGAFGIHVDGKWGTVPAHRFAYETLVGEIPVGMHLHHVCEVPACVNPDHLVPHTPGSHRTVHRTLSCIRGHGWTTENTWVDRRGNRHCRPCAAERQRERRRVMAAA